eukprot:COSAG02_NODE_12667_length_1512_cov_1.455060_2_plen_71_part_00
MIAVAERHASRARCRRRWSELRKLRRFATEQVVDGAIAMEMDMDDWKELGISGFQAAKIHAGLPRPNKLS